MVGNVAPVPGGIGVTEAALTAGLTAFGIPAAPALATVLLFRGITFADPAHLRLLHPALAAGQGLRVGRSRAPTPAVNSVPLQVLLYAFVAGASPVALGATLVVLGSRGGRWNALSFAIGVVIGQALLCAVAYAVGQAACRWATTPTGLHAALLELALGDRAAGRGRDRVGPPPDEPPAKPDSRAKAVLERLAHSNLLEVFVAGAVLALGPKRLGAHGAW